MKRSNAFLFLFLSSISVNLAMAGETVLLVSEQAENKHAILINEDNIENFEQQKKNYNVETEFSTLFGVMNRAGLKITKEMLDGRITIGADAGAHMAMGGEQFAFAGDVGVSARVNVASNAEREIFIDGAIYHMFRGNFKGISDKTLINSARVGLGKMNKNTKTSHQLSIYIHRDAIAEESDRGKYMTIPMYTFGMMWK